MNRDRFILTLGLGVGLILLATHSLHAQGTNCGTRARVLEHLQGSYGERRQAAGLAGEAQMVEVFASDDTGTWTILVTSASGVTCMIAAGAAFEIVPPPPAGDPA
jgi:hypothetical protein